MASSPLDQSPQSSPPRSQRRSKFLRSSSTKEASFSEFPYTPPRRSSPTSLSQSLHASPVSSPLHPLSPPPKHIPATGGGDHHAAATFRCVSSVLKKDGQVLAMAVSNGLVYTGSEVNVVRVWKLPEFSECGQLKSKAAMAVALEVSHDRVYVAYADGKIRVWQRTWDDGLKHVRIATIPKTGNYVRTYISRKEKMTKHMGVITSVAINVSEDIVYSASADKTVKVWRMCDLKCVETIRAHAQGINAMVVASDGVLFTASDDATVKVWRRQEQHHSLTVTLPAKQSPVKALALTAQGGLLYGGCTDGYIHFWLKGWHSGHLHYGGALQGHLHAVLCLASASASILVSGAADSTCRVWARHPDGAAHACLAVLSGHRGPVRCLAAFPSDSDHDALTVYTGSLVPSDSDHDALTVCTASLDGVIKLWRLTAHAHALPRPTPPASDYFDL